MRSDSDAEVIAASLETPALFGKVFDRYHTRIYKYVARRVGIADAADVTSEVFLKAFRLRYRYDQTRESCLPWLYGIARNTIGDQLRRTSRPTLHLDPTVVDEIADADDRAVAAAAAKALEAALGSLTEDDREALVLYAIEGLTYSEVAEALGVPSGTIGSRLNRARRKIREQIPDLEQIVDLVGRNHE